jgi:hypothetical protein
MIKKTRAMLVAVALLLLITQASSAPPEPPRKYVVINPYRSVDWQSFGQYKAGLHNHSTFSDGFNTRKAMLVEAYRKGFDVFVMTDHDWVTPSWEVEGAGSYPNRSHFKLIPSVEEKQEIESGAYSGEFVKGNLKPDYEEVWGTLDELNLKNYRRQSNGMIGLTHGIEHTSRVFFDHISSYGAYYNNTTVQGSEIQRIKRIVSDVQAHGGVSMINHPGRSLYRGDILDLEAELDTSLIAKNVPKYVNIFNEYESCLGLEIIGRLDWETRSTRALWDGILTQTMPQGRAVWGFSSDDAHELVEIGYSYNIMLMPELTEEAVLDSMKTGAFYAVARVARDEGVNAHFRNADRVMSGAGTPSTVYMLDDPIPRIFDITVQDNKIEISGFNYDTVEWIADGEIIAASPRSADGRAVLELNAYRSRINSYVRAQLKSDTGIVFTQPFGITLCCGDGLCPDCPVCGKCTCENPDCQQVKCGDECCRTCGSEHCVCITLTEPPAVQTTAPAEAEPTEPTAPSEEEEGRGVDVFLIGTVSAVFAILGMTAFRFWEDKKDKKKE